MFKNNSFLSSLKFQPLKSQDMTKKQKNFDSNQMIKYEVHNLSVFNKKIIINLRLYN